MALLQHRGVVLLPLGQNMELQVHPNDVPGVPDGAALLRTLREHFAMSGFRPGQLEAIQATLAGQDALVILPTGGGKSVAFQLPCHTRAHGFTVVVCPLLALAKDQVRPAAELRAKPPEKLLTPDLYVVSQVDKCEERGIYAEVSVRVCLGWGKYAASARWCVRNGTPRISRLANIPRSSSRCAYHTHFASDACSAGTVRYPSRARPASPKTWCAMSPRCGCSTPLRSHCKRPSCWKVSR